MKEGMWWSNGCAPDNGGGADNAKILDPEHIPGVGNIRAGGEVWVWRAGGCRDSEAAVDQVVAPKVHGSEGEKAHLLPCTGVREQRGNASDGCQCDRAAHNPTLQRPRRRRQQRRGSARSGAAGQDGGRPHRKGRAEHTWACGRQTHLLVFIGNWAAARGAGKGPSRCPSEGPQLRRGLQQSCHKQGSGCRLCRNGGQGCICIWCGRRDELGCEVAAAGGCQRSRGRRWGVGCSQRLKCS